MAEEQAREACEGALHALGLALEFRDAETRGYPRGLSGERIPLLARIFAVCDVYDALTSDRPYKRAWPHAAALQEISAQAGQHFDPRVVEAFRQVMQQPEWP